MESIPIGNETKTEILSWIFSFLFKQNTLKSCEMYQTITVFIYSYKINKKLCKVCIQFAGTNKRLPQTFTCATDYFI